MVEAILGRPASSARRCSRRSTAWVTRRAASAHADGSVTTPNGFKEAFKQIVEGGWIGISAPPEFGGQGLPMIMTQLVNEFLCSANMAFAMYPGLTQGAIAALIAHGTIDQRRAYLPKMVAGEWTGTMNLTEPHCGTDLGLLRTKAVKQPTAATRSPAPRSSSRPASTILPTTSSISCWRASKARRKAPRASRCSSCRSSCRSADGSLGARNGVSCGSIEEKMGIHGNATCVMNYDGATGWLVGEENRGLNAMFTMMNEARLGVGVQGLAQSEVAYQNAVIYAKERLQGRALTGAKAKDKPADPIIVHPDVRRTLMTIKSFNEAARALVMWTAIASDLDHRAADEKTRQAADDHMGLLTPVIKGVLTDKGFANTVMAQQMFGGHGYIAEHGMEQFVRDARIAMMYEGANGIQALDLVGRKLPKDGGRALQAFLAEVQGFIKEKSARRGDEALRRAARQGDRPSAAGDHVVHGECDGQAGQRRRGLDRLHAHVRSVRARLHVGRDGGGRAARSSKAGANGAEARMNSKLVTGRFFMERVLPETAAQLARIKSGAASTMELPAEAVLVKFIL